MTDLVEPERYRQAWRSRRERVLVLISFIVVFCVLVEVWPDPIVLTVCFAACMRAAYRYAAFRCPRCNEEFMDARKILATWPRSDCAHCGLPANTLPQD